MRMDEQETIKFRRGAAETDELRLKTTKVIDYRLRDAQSRPRIISSIEREIEAIEALVFFRNKNNSLKRKQGISESD